MESTRRQASTPARAAVTAGALLLAFTVSACSSEATGSAAPTRLTTGTPTTAEASTPAPAPTRSTIPTVAAPVPTRSTPAPTSTVPATKPAPAPPPAPAPTRTPASKPAVVVEPVSAPKPVTPPKPAAPPVKIVLENGDVSAQVRSVQARLRQIGWFSGDVTDRYGSVTAAAVSGFQRKRGLPVTGALDQTTYARLLAMTSRPTADELANVKPKPPEPTTKPTTPGTKPATPGTKPATDKPRSNGITWDVDQRCLTGRVMCVSKTARTLTWVVDGVPQFQFDVRFGSDELPTREGTFSVYKKKVDVISNLYHTPMPYSMFFSGGQAVHYSSNFARLGYSGASHGCVNVRDRAGIIRLYNESRVGDTVVVHW